MYGNITQTNQTAGVCKEFFQTYLPFSRTDLFYANMIPGYMKAKNTCNMAKNLVRDGHRERKKNLK